MSLDHSLDSKTFSSLSRIYMLALGFIAMLVLISQIIIQRALSKNDFDAKIINIAGKQRMLSQKISKNILLWNSELNIARDNNKELEEAINEWTSAHLLLENNLKSLSESKEKEKLNLIFKDVDLEIKTLISTTKKIQKNIYEDEKIADKWSRAFLLKEPFFLKKMNEYVYAYESYASGKINRIKNIEYIVFGLVITLLLIEFFFLFRPAARRIKGNIRELINSEDQALQMAEKANIAVKQKNETLSELQLLQKAINQTLFFARINKDGVILSSGRKIKELVERQKEGHNHIIYENLGLSKSDQQQLQQQVNAWKGSLLNHEFSVNIHKSNIEWLDISVFPIIKQKGVVEYLMVCLDITRRKRAQRKIEALNIERLDAEKASQKEKASLIVEAQEEERKRIAKDIHDSIGQMLTALKFNLESLDFKKEKTVLEKSINNLKKQTKNIILGVRMATFNLTPPELRDYGITTALQKMVSQLNKFSSAEIVFQNEITENLRFNTLVETNLYRVTQESINNAIKYANADLILVTIKSTEDLLSISITDNGSGFDVSKLEKKPKGGSDGGMGLFFMKERMSYISGRVFINSSNEGTRVVINYPYEIV